MFDTKIVRDLGMDIDIDGSKEVEGMEVEHDVMFGQGYEATLMMEKAMHSLTVTVLPELLFMKEIMEKVLEEPFWRARSSEMWSELYLGSQEIKNKSSGFDR